jgi:DnaD/phage-associated family protein
MYYASNPSVLYGDTMVPDVFITEYLPAMEGEFLKVYLYILFLSKHNKFATTWDISKKLNLSLDRVKEAVAFLSQMDVLRSANDKKLTLVDLKEKEIMRLYRPKTTSTPSEVMENQHKNKKRNETVQAINETFFQGLMSPSWYTDIDAWFDRFKFDEDVMYTLFHHCYENKGLFKNYVEKVAENWHNRNIKTAIELDQYSIVFQTLRDVRGKIAKKLKLGRMLTEYEEEYAEKWCFVYRYGFDVIEMALKKTTGRTSPSFNYIDTILTDWFSKGLKTKEDILSHIESQKGMEGKGKEDKSKSFDKKPQHSNFEQRSYQEDDFDKYYANLAE